jgi:hypothetical protein
MEALCRSMYRHMKFLSKAADLGKIAMQTALGLIANSTRRTSITLYDNVFVNIDC